MEAKQLKIAKLLFNVGETEFAEETHTYLKELFQDRKLNKLPVQKLLGSLNFID